MNWERLYPRTECADHAPDHLEGKAMRRSKRSSTVPVVKHPLKKCRPQKILLACILLLTPLIHGDQSEVLTWREAREGLEEAITLYEEQNFAEAGEKFKALRGQAPEGEFDPDALRLAEGTARLKSGNATEALAALEGIEGFDASRLQARKRLLEGNAAYQIARQALQEQDHEQAKTSAERAQESFRNALTVDPGNEAAAHNLELTQRFIETLPEPPPQENDEDQQEQEEQENDQEQESQDQNSGEEDQQDQQNQQDQQDQQEPQEDSSPEQESGEEQQEDEEQQDESGENGEDPQSDEDSSDPSAPSSPSDQEARDMPPEQVQQLLDNYDEQERRQRRQFLQQNARPIPVEKDW